MHARPYTRPMHTPRAVLLLLVAATLPACAVKPKPPLEGEAVAAGVPRPFAPVVMQIHPLTRIVRTGTGGAEENGGKGGAAAAGPMIVCHLELRDSWGDTCKGVGKLAVQLYRTDRAGGTGTQELRWDVDLSDLVLNAKLYDPATRTYRLTLEGLPEALASPDSRARLRLVAILQTWGPKGDQRTLQDEYVLEP